MAIKLKKDGILQTNFLTRREEKTGNVKVVISPNKFQVGLSSDETFQQGMCVYGQSQFFQGLSGSLTQLTDGTSYLIAGSNVTITTGTNGSITISSTGGGGGGGIYDGDGTVPTTTTATVTDTLTFSGSDSVVGVQNVQFDTEYINGLGHTTGRMFWDDDNKTVTLDMQGTDVRLQIGQEEHVYAFNNSGVVINNGDAVRISGANGANVTIEKAISSEKSFKNIIEQDEILGLATEQIGINKSGYVTTFGAVRDLDTSAFAEGDILYLSNATSGSYTNTKPPAPFFDARIGTVEVSSPTEGVVLVRPQEPIFLTDIASVTSSGIITNEKTYLCYDDSIGIISFTDSLTGSFFATGDISGSLTTLTDGTSYLVAGSSIDISSQSNGSVVISTTNVTASYVSSSVIEGGTVGEILAVNGSGVSEFTHNIVDATNTISLATLARYAYDGSGIISLDWGGRQLKYSNGSSASDWSTDNLLQVTGATDITGTLNVVDSITTEISDSAIILDYGVGGASGGKHIYYEASGFNPPTFTNRSAGAKAVLYPNLGASSGDWAIGIENGHIWFSVPTSVAARGFKFYGGTTEVAKINGDGALFIKENGTSPVPGSTFGAFWVKNDTPNVPYFTDDTGTDYQLAYVGAGVSDFFDSTTAGSIFTTGSAAFRGLESGVDSPLDKGTDNFFYVSGSTNSKDSATAGTSLFGGDVVASGTTYFLSSTYIADVAGAGLTTPPQGTDFSPLLVEINNSGLEYAAHFKNESESVGSTVAIGFSNRSGVYNIKGGIVYQSIGTFGRGDIHILQNSAADSTDADLTDKVATFYNAGGGEVYGDWKTVSLSGSLTHLDDGSSYLVAGTNVTIVSNSNGSVTISSTASGGGGGSGFFDSTTAGSIFTTGSTAIRGGESAVDSPSDKGSDVFFYVSGSEGTKDTTTAGTALFGGDVVVSGTLYGSVFVERQPTAIVSGTVQHYGWAVNKQKLINVQLYNYVTASQGSYDFTLFKDPDGTPVNLLQTSSYDLKTLTERTPTAVTLTSTAADLILEPGDVWRAQFEATSALIDAEGVYFLLNWELI